MIAKHCCGLVLAYSMNSLVHVFPVSSVLEMNNEIVRRFLWAWSIKFAGTVVASNARKEHEDHII